MATKSKKNATLVEKRLPRTNKPLKYNGKYYAVLTSGCHKHKFTTLNYIYNLLNFPATSKSIWKGIMSAAHRPIDAIKGIVSKVRDYLPFSPAKTGALKDIHRIRLIETIAQSIKAAPLIKAVGRVTSQVFQFKGQSVNPVQALAGGQSSGPVTIHFAPYPPDEVHISRV